MTETSRILKAAEGGDPEAASQLLPLVYEELRQLAAQKLALEKPGQTLDPTALVHEAYLRLTGDQPRQPWQGRAHFFAAAAEAMRRILIEKARRKRRLRHGGDRKRQPLDSKVLAEDSAEEQLLAVHDALDRLAETDAAIAELVKLRYFVGLTLEQAAEVLGVSGRTADRQWAYAKAWLYRELS
jgi:RNA polymerase sigma factor (TIGR02999 family)